MYFHSYLYSKKGQELFVTVSMLPPTLSGDATIFPYATLDLVHNNQSLGKTRLEKEKAYGQQKTLRSL